MKLIFLFLPSIFLFPFDAQAQLPAACGGGAAPAVGCDLACISCNFNGFSGSTAGYPSGPAVDFCGTVENAQWLGFIAGTGEATFTVMPANCLNGNGVQVALYSDCTKSPIACEKGEMDGGFLPVSITAPLNPGSNYYLLIDGYAGDQCDFTVSVTPNNAVYEPPLGSIQQVTGPSQLCPGATATYTVAEVFGAGAYIWSGPAGTLFDSLPSPATIIGAAGNQVQVTMGTASGPICVQAANSCNSTLACASSMAVEALPDSYRPGIEADTLQHLNCTDDPLVLLAKITPPGNYIFQWTADSLGHLVSGMNSPKPSVDKIGTYTLYVANTVNGCASTFEIAVGEPDFPTNAELALKHITCYAAKNGELKIGPVSGGLGPFVYALDGAPFLNALEFRYLRPGDHTLLLQGANGCEWDTTFTIQEPPELLLDMGADTTIHLGTALQLWTKDMVNYPDRIDQLLVTPAAISAMVCDTCMFAPKHSLRYAVTVLDSNGCKAADERLVYVNTERYVFIPNVFKPESPDGNNLFRVFCGEDVARVQAFRVLDRWGKLVFEYSDFLPDDPDSAWDGRLEGEKLPPNVFVYFAEVKFKDGETVQYRGDVTLVR